MIRCFAILLLALGLVACTGPAREQHEGYRVDHRHVAMSHSSRVRHLVIHYTDADETKSLVALTGPSVSSHYLIPPPRDGKPPPVYQLVEETRRAWHAGASGWAGRENLNDTSIGIEIVNAGPTLTFASLEAALAADAPITWASFPDAQITALIALARDIIARHAISPTAVVSHAEIAPTRKIDPGPAFPWQRLHAAGIGPWPDPARVARHRRHFAKAPPSLEHLQQGLAAWGFALAATGRPDATTRGALRAFQMRYRPDDYRGLPDIGTAARLWALLEEYRPEAYARLLESADSLAPAP
ncbi:N-acetylmuramoyl-L-alanine amidase [Halomonas sp. YLGW01]|uniref:N-acetylmuramoyl-L-alanine amidase n=1 Tax=Halomonas sp. YLGW01 TaxID=2773308 RepID=UPI0017815C7B|nr:N-acetylmuramoyl-L-alanine amidase [Halomonas sp. YLGW01]